MEKTYKGGIMSIILVILLILGAIVASAMFFGRGTTEETAQNAVNIVKEKGVEAVATGKEKALEAAGDAAMEAKDAAVTEGKKVVGEAMKEAGENMIGDHSTPGSYEEYSAEKIADSGGAILDFYATWCPSCRALDKNITANLDKIPEGVVILKVDYDEEKDLKKKYGVVQQHTLVQVDADGNEINKWVGSPTLEHVLANVK